MSHIIVLDNQVANLIAAGEVVDRPASAIKEMLENSIDAGAGEITVEIKNGGCTFMRVSDNGCGIPAEDLPLAIKRHATSKIRTAEDLNAISTLGFRGEALAAIASVSRTRIMTKTRDSELGASMEVDNGSVTDVESVGCPDGTTIIVEELFASVPARQKFLKNNKAETAASAAVVEKIALSHPEIAVRFIADGELKFRTAGNGELKDAIYAVLGRDFAAHLIETGYTTAGITVSGYIGDPQNNRGNRNSENFFINGRYVRCRTASAALENAFDTYMPHERFPACVLDISILPAFVDVNVHPAKLEVKFSNDRVVFDAVYCAVKNALTQNIDRPQLSLEGTMKTADDMSAVTAFVPVFDRMNEDADGDLKPTEKVPLAELETLFNSPLKTEDEQQKLDIPQTADSAPTVIENGGAKAVPGGAGATRADPPAPASATEERPVDLIPDAESIITSGSLTDKKAPTAPSAVRQDDTPSAIPADEPPSPGPGKAEAENPAAAPEKLPLPYYRVLGEAFNCYIFVELSDRVLVIDQHAAHERIIFEQMRRNRLSGKAPSQMMLIPQRIRLERAEYEALRVSAGEIMSMGFGFTLDESSHSAEMLSYPAQLEAAEAAELLEALASNLSAGEAGIEQTRAVFFEKALFQASCKAAVKGGRIYAEGHINWIVEQLLTDPTIKYCPHGRPVSYEMTKHAMDRTFGRLG